MVASNSLNAVARLVADPARTSILTALMDGRARTAGELSMVAGISPQNASGHLDRLLRGDLIAVEVQGRHRYYRLTSPSVAQALESLAAISSTRSFTAPESPQLSQIRFLRTCYDHMAGSVATEIAASLLARGLLEENEREFVVTPPGEEFFSRFDIEIASLRVKRRALARRCLDWTERRPHIGGALGAAILKRFKERRWIMPMRRSRAVRITHGGEHQLWQHFRLRKAYVRTGHFS
jgi:DNA-binding transcriptional ArsR family regulator